MPIFVIHEHHARHLHYDFRIESGGVLKSWAVPKAPPMRKGIKRLAIQVEDHPKSYANFEGEITEGYGKGIVKIWDYGNYKLEEKTPQKYVFTLQGKRMRGKFSLVKANFKDSKNDKQWLLMKIM